MMRCHGTNRRGATRCRREARTGEHTCGLHKDQDVRGLVELRDEPERDRRAERDVEASYDADVDEGYPWEMEYDPCGSGRMLGGD